MPNRLLNETSPYLLQHAHNPVDWYPWGPEALGRAKAEDRPILLSVGYSACHWCHVMERESFEDAVVAARMNADFVNIKVDREERPDLDELYMRAVQAFTGGRGGWPMTLFLTPAGEPYLGGTYFPPRGVQGMPAFSRVLAHAAALYRDHRDDVERTCQQIRDHLAATGRLPRPAPPAPGAPATDGWLERVAEASAPDFDPQHGGFGDPPKFPPHGQLAALLAHSWRTGDAAALERVTTTLNGMARGGMYDLLGGGFARYSTDDQWRIPHFEKMLYDNAQLVPVYLDAMRICDNPRYGRIARETLEWVLREMTDPAGGFYSALDADSEGVEGRFYAWTPEQIRAVLGGEDGDLACEIFEVTEEGTFEHGMSVLRLDPPLEARPGAEQDFIRDAMARLAKARAARVRPATDDKVITAWNALMISAFARAGAVFDEPRYRGAATRAARFVLDGMRVEGRLLRTRRGDRAHTPAFADDYACMVQALIDTWECTFDLDWLAAANDLADRLVDLFWDDVDGGLYYTGSDAEPLLARSKRMLGGAEPSANAVAAVAFARLDVLCGRADLGERADRILACLQPLLPRAPRALGVEAIAAGWRAGPTRQIALVGGRIEHFLDEVHRRYLPFAVLAWTPRHPPPLLPLLDGKTAIGGQPTAYLCEDRTCLAPTTDAAEFEDHLDRLAYR